jgi:competence protein ComEC
MRVRQPSSGPLASRLASLVLSGSPTVVPLFHASWLFACGIAISHYAWLRPSIVLVALFPLAMFSGLAGLRAQRIRWLALAALWCLLGAWCAEMEPQPAPSQGILKLEDGLLRTVDGTIVDAAPVRAERPENVDEAASETRSQRVDLRTADIEVVDDAEDRQFPIDGALRLTVRWPDMPADPLPHLQCGDHIRTEVRLLPPQEYRDPGAWSRTGYLLGQGITATASVDVDHVERLGAERSSTFHCRIAGWQQLLNARLLALPAAMRRLPLMFRLSDTDAVILAAMTTGDRTLLTHSLRAGFERTGSFHMLVVSGLHLAIVAGCIFWIARRVRLPRIPATLLTIAASFGYAMFTGFATPVQRSFWMVTLYLLGRLLYRERSPLNAIGFATLCLLAVSPRGLFDSSFQMTLLAVVSIAGIAAPLLEKTVHPYLTATRDLHTVAIDVKLEQHLAQFRVELRMLGQRLQRAFSRRVGWKIFPWCIRFGLRCVELLAVSLVVELAMTLPMAIYFHRITIFALPVNIFILPLLAVLMPAALLTLALLTLYPAAGLIPAMVAAAFLHLGVGLVHLFGSAAFGDFRIPAPALWQSAAFCVLLALAMILARGGGWQRRASWVSLVLAAFAAVVPHPIAHPHDALLVEAIDVGQGDALLLITPDGKTMLVDGGGFGGGPRQAPQDFDIGEEVVSPALWARGIRHLDVVALSHAHSDHIGGLPAVLRNFHPSELWVGNNPPSAAYRALLEEAGELGVAVRPLRAGDAVSLGRADVRVLAPLPDYQPGPEPANNDSLVLHVAYDATSVLLEGDAEAPIEQAMLAEAGLQSTLLKAAHHGSVTSTRPEFLARVAPRYAVISCGLHNRYGHPRAEVLAELQEAKVRTYSTDIEGARCFALDGKKANVVPCD